MRFICNICGGSVVALSAKSFDRESGWCSYCGSTVRQRSLVHLLSSHLFNRSLPIPAWPRRTDLRGIGISDWHRFAEFFTGKVSYFNTHYDRKPFLDIRDPPSKCRALADFVICSDVLEHVPPPVQPGFDGIHSLLKPGGSLILTVPYGFENTKEHFPDLYHWFLESDGAGRKLVNTTRYGGRQIFRNLRFHEGSGQVLEMRVFGLNDVVRHVQKAGFIEVSVFNDDVPEYGIHLKYPWSRPLTAKRPLLLLK